MDGREKYLVLTNDQKRIYFGRINYSMPNYFTLFCCLLTNKLCNRPHKFFVRDKNDTYKNI